MAFPAFVGVGRVQVAAARALVADLHTWLWNAPTGSFICVRRVQVAPSGTLVASFRNRLWNVTGIGLCVVVSHEFSFLCPRSFPGRVSLRCQESSPDAVERNHPPRR